MSSRKKSELPVYIVAYFIYFVYTSMKIFKKINLGGGQQGGYNQNSNQGYQQGGYQNNAYGGYQGGQNQQRSGEAEAYKRRQRDRKSVV